MKESTVKLYRCEYCDKKYFRKHAASNHEEVCFKNPSNYQPCLNGCKYLDREEVTIDVEYGCFKAKAFVCRKHNQLMYPLKAKRLNDKYDLEAHDQIQMPLLKCDDFEEEDYCSLFIK